jgi:hypothetical protein
MEPKPLGFHKTEAIGVNREPPGARAISSKGFDSLSERANFLSAHAGQRTKSLEFRV